MRVPEAMLPGLFTQSSLQTDFFKTALKPGLTKALPAAASKILS